MRIPSTNYLFLLILSLVSCAFPALGQGFYKTYPATNGNCKDVVQATDGSYYMAGVFLGGVVQHTNSTGAVIWTNPNTCAGGNGVSVCRSNDGGCVVLGENFPNPGGLTKNTIAKINDNGVMVWQTVVDNYALPNGLKSVLPLVNGYLACGNTRDSSLKQQIWLVKLDEAGNVIWNKALGIPDLSEQVVRCIPSSDGNYVIAGSVLSPGENRDIFLAKVDPNGNLLWQHVYPEAYYQVPNDVLESSDGGLVVLADQYQSDPVKTVLFKTNPNGTKQWYKAIYLGSLSSSQTPLISVFAFTHDELDNYYLAVHSYDQTIIPGLFKIIKLNANADVVDNFDLPSLSYTRRAVFTADSHLLLAGGDEISQSFLIKTDLEGQFYSNFISGYVYRDENNNCTQDSSELPMNGYVVEARNGSNESYFQFTDVQGHYHIRCGEGNFQVIAHPPNGIPSFNTPCDTPTVSIAGINQQVTADSIGIGATILCPLMDVSVVGGLLRRCMETYYSISYCNNGNITAENVHVVLTVDPALSFISSTAQLSSQQNDQYTFDLPSVLPDDCGSFVVKFGVSCTANIGQTICVEAHIYPDSVCLPPGANWDGSVLEVNGECNNGAKFTIANNSNYDMTQSSDYVIIEDQIMFLGKIQLHAHQDTVIQITNPGAHSYYLRADQIGGYPGFGNPAAFVSNCGGTGGQNLQLQLAQNDESPFIDIACEQVVGSYDPNDKRGFPLGWKENHLIEPGQEIEYMIRFQNTGNDTAFTVAVKDEISPLLDMSTLKPGTSSHPYTWEIRDGRTLFVHFAGILLPDSTVNESASHGFIMFKIKPKADLPLGTVVENSANIYFDFNDPVQTNTCFHTVGQKLTAVQDIRPEQLGLDIFPNPFNTETIFRLSDAAPKAEKSLSLYNLTGQLLRTESFSGNEYVFKREALLPGLYMFRIQTADGKWASGKITVF